MKMAYIRAYTDCTRKNIYIYISSACALPLFPAFQCCMQKIMCNTEKGRARQEATKIDKGIVLKSQSLCMQTM